MNIDTCKSRIPSTKKVETYGKSRIGKGLWLPVIDKSLLSKSKMVSIAAFRAAWQVAPFVETFSTVVENSSNNEKEMCYTLSGQDISWVSP